MLGLAAIGLFLSTLTDTPVGAMAATAGLAVLSGVARRHLPGPGHPPWLFTHHWLAFGDLLRPPCAGVTSVKDLLLQAGYIALFGTAAWARFTTKDVLPDAS